MLKVQNIVLTTSLSKKLNLEEIFAKIPTAQYNRMVFPGLILRVLQPKATLLLFRSGKVVCVGVKTVNDGEEALKLGLEMMGLSIKKPKLQPQLFVGSGEVGFRVDLCKLYEYVGRKCMYETELFPGLVYKMKNITFLIFSTGKLIVTGAKHEHELHQAYKIISITLEKCKICL